MKLHININLLGFTFKNDDSGDTYDALIVSIKEKAIPIIVDRSPRLLRGVIRRKLEKMSPLQFTQEVIRQYNKQFGTAWPQPKTCEQFVTWAVARGYATLERG
jgi:hypothetical protein